ncbi:hypothetical protein FMA36_15090 [Komagataeibacter xylinus]|uniref:Uncharacterized protein n=1 Tax=Komagataeibacter xylinus TaxID=28448 RepID=A0A857FR73_KOMXY|nr:hypothetical protein FMA36_15090 [Komagataeibacter xylinus]
MISHRIFFSIVVWPDADFRVKGQRLDHIFKLGKVIAILILNGGNVFPCSVQANHDTFDNQSPVSKDCPRAISNLSSAVFVFSHATEYFHLK